MHIIYMCMYIKHTHIQNIEYLLIYLGIINMYIYVYTQYLYYIDIFMYVITINKNWGSDYEWEHRAAYDKVLRKSKMIKWSNCIIISKYKRSN